MGAAHLFCIPKQHGPSLVLPESAKSDPKSTKDELCHDDSCHFNMNRSIYHWKALPNSLELDPSTAKIT